MPLYRILKNLSTKRGVMERGCIENLDWGQDKLDALEQVGAISRVSTPPLEELPNWENRAKKLLPSVVTVEEFLLAEDSRLATALGIDVSEIPAIKTFAWGWLDVDKEKPCG